MIVKKKLQLMHLAIIIGNIFKGEENMNNIEVIKRFLNKRAGHTPLRITMNGYKEMTLKTNGL